MKKLMVALPATWMIAFAVPVLAHEYPDEPYARADDWDNGGDSYAAFDQEYRHIWQGIQHRISDGSYTSWQAQRFYRAMQQIHARADWMERRGLYAPDDIQRCLERLHDDMHVAHERGHERLDESFGYGERYAYDPR